MEGVLSIGTSLQTRYLSVAGRLSPNFKKMRVGWLAVSRSHSFPLRAIDSGGFRLRHIPVYAAGVTHLFGPCHVVCRLSKISYSRGRTASDRLTRVVLQDVMEIGTVPHHVYLSTGVLKAWISERYPVLSYSWGRGGFGANSEKPG